MSYTCRVVQRADGGVTVIHPTPKSRRTFQVQVGEWTVKTDMQLPDGTPILRLEPVFEHSQEPEGVWLERVFLKAMDQPTSQNPDGTFVYGLRNRPYVDMDTVNLPRDRAKRNQWRVRDGKVVDTD